MDLIVLLPGIAGSKLAIPTSSGNDWVWDPPFRIRPSLLSLTNDDPNSPHAPDGVIATGAVDMPQIISGLLKADGYVKIITSLRNNFTETKFDPVRVYSYDWRRDIRTIAQTLKTYVDSELESWRSYTCNREAKAIFIAHSMGGLIVSEYLYHLGGGHDCSAFITLGTPFRGSPKALNYLINGYNGISKGLGERISTALRSYKSLRQMVPDYPTILNGGTGELVPVPSSVQIASSHIGKCDTFISDLRQIRERNRSNFNFFHKSIVGYGQPTIQSLILSEGNIEPSIDDLPPLLDRRTWLQGDGTVPLFSASIGEGGNTFHVDEQHSHLQSNPTVLGDIVRTIHSLKRGAPIRSDLTDQVSFVDYNSIELPDQVMIRSEFPLRYRLGHPDTRAQIYCTHYSQNGIQTYAPSIQVLDATKNEATIELSHSGINEINLMTPDGKYLIGDFVEVLEY